MSKWLLVAVDAGPVQTLQPLSLYEEFLWESNPGYLTSVGQWVKQFDNLGISGVVVGTSRSYEGTVCETACRIAAKITNRHLVAIEDYPGNYEVIEQANVDKLVVESSSVAELITNKLGNAVPSITIGATIRYDSLRGNRTGVRKHFPSTFESSSEFQRILWVGQPETEDGIATLTRLLPDLAIHQAEFLFKAHPRDRGYKLGAYTSVLDKYGLDVRDVSDLTFGQCLGFAPRLVATQYSSLAVEAGFYGIPSIHVLYPDIGGKRLKMANGYSVPFLCSAGGSVIIQNMAEQQSQLAKVLLDSSYRHSVMEGFDRYYCVSELMADSVASKILSLNV